ncbi:hypothetical protein C4N9_15550 [Pararhodobacter marinus]|uniref:Uncharacterized protein n=1 Tax=Pararhodobacter marinus TaxID=2184063 RepID=A0A2U2C7K9_9RHOB|nr:class I SAM-dependent methyltransferase [Pararhodobacter marinus]PWE27843.1 hypothetical protein C4N9_15550 [Pararhodobacter marinus]
MTDPEALRFYNAAAERLGDALPAGATILDLGCGHGVAAAHLANAGFDVTGLDPSARLLAVARRIALAMLEGKGQIRDPRGLPYTFVTEADLTALLSEAGFRDVATTRAPAPAGVAGRDSALHLRATRARTVDPGAV